MEAERKLSKQKEGKAKSNAEDIAAMKAAEEKAELKRKEKQKAASERAAKQKEGLEKSKAEDLAAIKADEEKAKKARGEKLAKQKEGLEKSKAEDLAAMKADAEKRKQALAEREAKELEKKKLEEASSANKDRGHAEHVIPKVLGTGAYKTTIADADTYFKMKRYAEAKTAYENALKLKANDAYATGKLAELNKIITK